MEFLQNLNLGQWIVIGLSAFMLAWYFGANAVNRNRGVAAYRWLYHSLEGVGKITTAEWFGSSSSGGRLLVEKPSRPFRRLEAVFLLERREFLPYWIVKHIQGWRDEVKIKIDLQTSPKLDLVIAHTENPKSASSATDPIPPGYEILPSDGSPHQTDLAPLLEKLAPFLRANASYIQNLTIRPTSPHIEISGRLNPMLSASPSALFTSLQEIFQLA